MNENAENASRELLNNSSILLDDEPVQVAAYKVRPVTLTTLSALAQIGNTLVADGGYDETKHSITDLCIFLWVHSAPLEEVIKRTTVKELAFARCYEAAMLWGQHLGTDDLKALSEAINEETARVNAARADAVPDKSAPASKNALGQSEPRR